MMLGRFPHAESETFQVDRKKVNGVGYLAPLIEKEPPDFLAPAPPNAVVWAGTRVGNRCTLGPYLIRGKKAVSRENLQKTSALSLGLH